MVNAPEIEQEQNIKNEQNGKTASPSKPSEDKPEGADVTEGATLESATELLNKGKRNYICQNIAQSVSELSQSCAQFDKLFGEGNIKCAKSYYWYGNALLDMARLENGVLGNALQGTQAEESAPLNETTAETKEAEVEKTENANTTTNEDEKLGEQEKVAEKVEKMEANTEEKEEETSKEENGDEKDENGDEDMEKEEEADKENEDGENAEEGEEGDDENKTIGQLEESIGGEEEEEDDDDEDDSLKLSWQMLDWARKLLETATEAEVEGRDDLLAQCFLKLGENLMEAAHHTEAEVEFKKCIDIYHACQAQSQAKKSELAADIKSANLIDRSLAEAYFIAGLNLVNGKNYTNACNHFGSAIDVLKKRISILQTKLEKCPDDAEDFSKVIEELKEFLPNIMEKMVEAKLCSAQEAVTEGSEGGSCSSGASALQQAFKEVEQLESKSNGDEKSAAAIDSAPAKDISHLVKRKNSPLKQKVNGAEHKEVSDGTTKRKGDSTESDESVSKKPKVDETPEAASTANVA